MNDTQPKKSHVPGGAARLIARMQQRPDQFRLAVAFHAGDANDFSDEGKLASYFGIVPRVDQSNHTRRMGSITRRGNKLARTALIQSALIAKRYSRYLDSYYQRIKKRRGAGRAIIALARKFLGIIYRTLKNDWIFEDFTTFTLASKP